MMKLSDVASILDAHVSRDASFEALGKSNHRKPNMLGFAEEAKQLRRVAANPEMSCVVTTPELEANVNVRLGVATCADPRLAFYRLHEHFASNTEFYWKTFPSEISPDAHIHPAAFISPTDVRIGRGTVVEAHASVLERTIIGEDCVICGGAVVGGRGFEFRPVDGRMVRITHTGGLRIGDRVQVNHNTVIDRAVYGGWSSVGDDTKIDSLTQVAHNVQIGCRCLIGAGVDISGNNVIEDEVRMGPGAVVSNGLNVGAGSWVTLGSVVVRDVPTLTKVTGNFAVDHERFRRWMDELRSRKHD